MKDNKASRSKRSLTIINLIQTNAGYSIIQGTELLNKVQNQPPVVVPNPNPNTTTYQPPVSILKQQPKMTIKQNNLVFLKSPTNFNPESKKTTHQKQQQNACKQSLYFAKWFNFNQVSEFQKNQVKNWTQQWSSGKSTDDLTLNGWFEKYKKHRNIIIQIYYANCQQNKQYLSASTVRKFICDDAKWLMKIHLFLTSWGIINSNNINFDNQNLQVSSIFKLKKSGQYDVVNIKSSFYSNSKQNKNQCVQNYSTLKKITDCIRPYCDYCGIHCQIVWFQHIRIMDPKQISSIMKNVNSKNPPLSQKQYEIILCTKCYCNGNFPLLLTHHDFRKVSVNDRLQPDRKKKSNKNKKKQKKRKMRQKQLVEQEEEQKDEHEELDDEKSKRQKDKQKVKPNEANNKSKQKQKQGQQQCQQENESEKDEINSKDKDQKLDECKQEKQIKQPAKQNKQKQGNEQKQKKQVKSLKQNQSKDLKLNGVHNVNQNQNDNRVLTQAQKQAHVNQIIRQIIRSVKSQRTWTFQQNKKLLQLVEEYEDDWDAIYKSLSSAGLCKDCQPEDLILHFIKLPQMNISELIEQNNNQRFVNENKNEYKSDFLTKKIQRNYNNSMKLFYKIEETKKTFQIPKNDKWKDLLNKFTQLYIRKVTNNIQTLTQLNKRTLKQQRAYEKATKQLYQN